MTNRQKDTWAKVIGDAFAYGQHAMDRAIGWGLKRMKDVGDAPKKNTAEPDVKGKTRRAGKSILKFFGEVGDEFYTKYEELKRKP